MVTERCLKKSFKDSLEDIKERMKEKRNNKWAKLGKKSQVLIVKSKITDNSSAQQKSFQENNRALALALEEEKRKMKEAQDTILYLKREYQQLKFQMFVLQKKLELQQVKEHNESRLVALKKIISKVVQDLLSARNLLGPASDQYTIDFNQILHPSELEEHDSSNLRKQDYMALLSHVLPADVSEQDKTFRTKMQDNINKNYSDATVMSQTDTGWQNCSNEDHLDCERRYSSLNEEDWQIDNCLPKNVSARRRHLGITSQNELFISGDENTRITEQIKDPCQQDKTGHEANLEEDNEQSKETCVYKENIHEINSDQNLGLSDTLTQSNTLTAATKCTEFKNSGNFKTQKRKLETLKNVSKSRSKKKKSHSEEHCSKERTGTSRGSSDAYDFTCEESVHVTPFRQNKEHENESKSDGKNDVEETDAYSSESFISEEDSNDSLYIPYTQKSKSKQNSSCESAGSPVHTRPRLNKIVNEQQDRNPDKKNRSTKQDENFLDKKTVPDQTACSLLLFWPEKGKSRKVERIKSKKNSCESSRAAPEPYFPHPHNEPPSPLQKRLHLGNITNLASSSSSQTRVSHPPITTEGKYTSSNRRRCTLSVSYKEPSISGKLRRGDPFTDTGFLNSPIFKEKKSSRKSVKKKSLSRYNEAFVGCR